MYNIISLCHEYSFTMDSLKFIHKSMEGFEVDFKAIKHRSSPLLLRRLLDVSKSSVELDGSPNA